MGKTCRILGLMTAMLPLLVFSSCGGPPPPSGETPGASGETGAVDPGLTEYMPAAPKEKGDWLILRLPDEMPHLNPVTSTDAYSDLVLSWVFDPLLDRDPQTLEMKPNLAESYEASEDHLTYVFHLRRDAKFSDGTPLTAQDVKFTFDRILDPAVDAPHLRSYFEDITAVEAQDDYTVKFSCAKTYYRHAIMIGGVYIIPRHIYGQGDFNNHPNNRQPVGSGPYVLEKWETGREVVLKRNTNYWGDPNGRPWFDRIVYKVLTDDNAAFQMLARGDLDSMNLTPEDWTRRANTDKFKERFNRFVTDRPAYNYLGWNLRKPQFQDKNVRRALAMLMDRDTIRDEIFKGLATNIIGGFMPGTPEYNTSIAPVPFDPAGAAALLEAAGWKDSNGDALRDRDGVKFSFEVLTGNQNPIAEKILTLYKEELARAGVELVIRPLEWASMLDRVDKREFDAILMGWQMPPDPDPHQVWHSSQVDKGSNYIGFANAEADRMIDDARVAFDRNERIRLYHRFQEILADEQPYLFLLAPKALVAADKRIQGIHVYPFGMEQREWFAPKALQRYGN